MKKETQVLWKAEEIKAMLFVAKKSNQEKSSNGMQAWVRAGVMALFLSGSSVFAAPDTWSGAIDGDWNNLNNWSGGVPVVGSSATFGNNANTGVTLSAPGTALSIVFTGAGAGAFTIGTAGGPALSLATGGSISMDSAVVNSETVNAPLTLGVTGGNTGYSFTNSAASTANVLTIGGSVTGAASPGNTTSLTLNGTNTGNNTVSGVIGNGAAGGMLGISKSSTGTWVLTNANTYTGATTISNGILVTNLLADGGTASGIGASSNAASNLVISGTGATLQYTGGAVSTDRLFTMSANGKIDSSGTGAIDFTNTGAIAYGTAGVARVLTLTGTNTGNNTLAAYIGDNTTGAVSVVKSGTGIWVLTGANGYTNGTTINAAGTLVAGNTAALGATGAGVSLTAVGATLDLATDTSVNAYNITIGNIAGAVTIISDRATSGSGITQTLGTLSIGAASSGTTLNIVAGGNVTGGSPVVALGNVTLTQGFGGGSIFNPTTASVTLGNVTSLATTSHTDQLTLDGTSTGNAITGNIDNGVIGGSLAVVKSNSSTWTLSGNNTYTNATTINGGILQFAQVDSMAVATATVGSGGTLAVNAGGTGEFTNGTGSVAGSIGGLLAGVGGQSGIVKFNSGSALGIDTTNAAGGTLTYSGNITTAGTAGTTAFGVTKLGSNTLVLSGANTYTGATTVSAGTLKITGSTSSSSAVAVNAGTLIANGTVGGTVNVASGATLSGTGTVGALTVTGGSIVNLQDGATHTLSGTSTLTFNTGTGNGVLSIDVGSGSSSDLLALTGAASLGSNLFTVNVNSLSGASTGIAYTFISASGGLTLADFTAGTLTGTLAGDTVTFSGGGSSVMLTINAAASTNYYYTGNSSSAFATASNYNTLATGGTTQSTPLSSTSDVFIAATSHSNVAPTLGGTDASIHSLTFTSDGAGGSVNSTGGQLTVAAGVTDSAGGTSTETVNAPVALGGDQSFTVTSSGNTLAMNGQVSGSHALTIAGAGKVKLASDNTYSNGTTVGSGTDSPTLLLTNGHTSTGSATGTGPLLVQAGATIGGDGTSRSSSFAINGNVMVGNGTDSTSQTTITGTTASTFTNANLTFNLNTANTNSNILNVGDTAIDFSNVTLTLNLQGGNIIAANTAYVLIAGTGTGQYTGFSTSLNDQGLLQISGLTLAFADPTAAAYYANSYLYLNTEGGVDDIEVQVVPEPDTWALIMSGLTALVFWQRRRHQSSCD